MTFLPWIPAPETDPVCGMVFDAKTTALTIEHAGKTYYFCFAGCLKKFTENPSGYTK